jgi:DnaJ-domain-containing protein 1
VSLDWPRRFERTSPGDRGRNNSFDVTLSKAFSDLETELDRLGVEDDGYRYSLDARQRNTDQRPYQRANPDDPGFVLRWRMDGADYAVACDRYSRLRDNVRTVGLYLREKRKMEQRPVVTGESEFANARLPSGDDETEAVVARQPPHEVLGVEPDAPEAAVKGAYRGLLKERHPDHGGSQEDFERLQEAKEAMLDE